MIDAGYTALAGLAHRGPDANRAQVFGNVFLGHTRLSILDLSDAGAQPMVSRNERVAIAVNGEIYNHRQLRAALNDVQFQSQSDSEVLLHAYPRWGLDRTVAALDGMYAAAVYDADAQVVHLLRDRVGIKPLYLAQAHHRGIGVVAWASELPALKRFCDPLSIDPTAIADFAALRYIPAPKTLFRDITQVEAAHVLTLALNNGTTSSKRYWALPTELRADDDDRCAAAIREAVEVSVEEQLMADVPVGVFLSGGIDSSIIAQCAAAKRSDLTAYTVGFDEASHDETRAAAAWAAHLGLQHQSEQLSLNNVQDLDAQMLAWFGQPFGDLSAVPTARLCGVTHQSSVVALAGDGADELFGGYRWYQRFARFRRGNAWVPSATNLDLRFYRPPVNTVQKLLNRLALWGQFDPVQLYGAINSNLLSSELAALGNWLELPRDYDPHWALRRYYRPELGLRRALQYMEFHTWLPDDILTKVDRTSMAVSLEVRVPFLSRALCELAFSLPERFHYRGGELKGGLKYAFRDDLPKALRKRPKRGFSIPHHAWKDRLLEGHPGYVHYLLARLQRTGFERYR